MHSEKQEAPPFFKHWSSVYILVAGVLLVVGILFYLFTRHFE